MSLTTIYRPFGVTIHTDDIDPIVTIAGLTDYGVNDNPNVRQEFTDGAVYPTRVSKRGGEESITFSSLNIDSVLDAIGVAGTCLKGDTGTKNGFKLYLQGIQECDTVPGSSNLVYTVPLGATVNDSVGLIVPQTLNVDHQGDASIAVLFRPKGATAGTAGIAVPAVVGSLPTIVDTKRRFGMGPVTIGAATYDGRKSMNINFGVQIGAESADGGLYPEKMFIDQIGTQITFRGIDPNWLAAAKIPRAGKGFAHANTTFYLRRYKDDGTDGYEANGSAVHIKGTAAGKAFITNIASGQARNPTETVLVMWLEHDGTNVPLTLTTAQTIT